MGRGRNWEGWREHNGEGKELGRVGRVGGIMGRGMNWE